MRTALWLCVSLVATASPLHGGDSLRISVSPAYSYAPSTLKVRVRLEPNAANRAVEIIVDGDDFYRSSEINVDGEQGPATVELSLRNVPGGDYQVVAVLKDHAGRPRARAGQEVTVMSMGDHH